MGVTSIVVLFLLLLVVGTPVGYIFYFVGGLYLITNGVNLGAVVAKMGSSMNSINMVAVPMFIFAGTFMNHLNLTDSIFNAIMVTPVGKMKGGLAQVNVIASLVFAGMSGAALADVGGLGKIEIKAMVNAGYSLEDATGITLASSTLGPLFPPSIPLMLYALYAEQSGIRMLAAGILPAILMCILFMGTVSFLAHKKKWPTYDGPTEHKTRWKIFIKGIPGFMVPVLLLAGMYSGKFASSELAAVCSVIALLVAVFCYHTVSWKTFVNAAKESVANIGAMFFICGAASVFAQVISRAGVAAIVQNFVTSLNMSWFGLLIIINIIFLIIGMFMDSNVAIMIFTPILLPSLIAMGIDPIHFGVVICLNVVIGIFTPPFGTALFLGQAVTGLSFARIVKAMVPYFVPLLLGLLLITAFPWISTLIPNMMFG